MEFNVAVRQSSCVHHLVDVECIVGENHRSISAAELESLQDRWRVVNRLPKMRQGLRVDIASGAVVHHIGGDG